MTSALNPAFISSSNPRYSFAERCYIANPSPCAKRLNRASSLMPRRLLLKCSSSSEQREMGGLKELLAGVVDERVEQLLNREENRDLLDELEKASERVEMKRRELAEIQKQEIEAQQMRSYISHLEARASEIEECQTEILEARTMVEEAERFLNVDGNRGMDIGLLGIGGEEIGRDEERWESIKAASISALVGTLAGLPISLAQATSISQLILPLGINFVSCALFGVTFRYAVRRDLDNFQLKTGTCAAFGIVKGLGAVGGGPPFEWESGSLRSHGSDGAFFVSQSLLIFAFASVGLDFCYKMRILSPFPIKRQVLKSQSKQ